MNNVEIKLFSKRFIAYLMFILLFSWWIPYIIFFVIYFTFELNFPTVVNVLLSIAYTLLMPFSIYYLMNKLPYKRSEKLVQEFMEQFPITYSLHYDDNYWIADEGNGRLAVVAKKNPYQIQVIDASKIDAVGIFPKVDPAQKTKMLEIGIVISIGGKTYKVLTYNGVRVRFTYPVAYESEAAQTAFHCANEFAIHILNAKEAAERVKSHATNESYHPI